MIVFRLANILHDFKMTQLELCERTNIRPATINGMYHGRTKRLNIQSLDKICRALDCTTEDILEYIPDEVYEEMFKGRK